jgi:hypothetical protein
MTVTATETPSSLKTRVIPDFLPTNPIAIGFIPGLVMKRKKLTPSDRPPAIDICSGP